MKKILLALFILLVPSISLAQTELTVDKVGACRQINNGFWQQMPDGTWASPGDRLNTCEENGAEWESNNQFSPFANQYQYNPDLARMDSGEWLLTCVILNSILPQSRCQSYSPLAAGRFGQSSRYNSYLQYPRVGRNYVSIGGENSSLTVSSDKSNDFWKTALIGVGMGWLLNRLTS